VWRSSLEPYRVHHARVLDQNDRVGFGQPRQEQEGWDPVDRQRLQGFGTFQRQHPEPERFQIMQLLGGIFDLVEHG
jgi:hypothetical protein